MIVERKAVLAGSLNEFRNWLHENPEYADASRASDKRTRRAYYIASDRSVRGYEFDSYVTYGTFHERRDAREILGNIRIKV